MKQNWFNLWKQDKDSILSTMRRNMTADLDAGYDPNGNCINRQKADIAVYEADIDFTLRKFREMTETAIQHWCHYDLVRRGAIE